MPIIFASNPRLAAQRCHAAGRSPVIVHLESPSTLSKLMRYEYNAVCPVITLPINLQDLPDLFETKKTIGALSDLLNQGHSIIIPMSQHALDDDETLSEQQQKDIQPILEYYRRELTTLSSKEYTEPALAQALPEGQTALPGNMVFYPKKSIPFGDFNIENARYTDPNALFSSSTISIMLGILSGFGFIILGSLAMAGIFPVVGGIITASFLLAVGGLILVGTGLYAKHSLKSPVREQQQKAMSIILSNPRSIQTEREASNEQLEKVRQQITATSGADSTMPAPPTTAASAPPLAVREPQIHFMEDMITLSRYQTFIQGLPIPRPPGVVLVFPGNSSHHTKSTTLYSHKSGNGLAQLSGTLNTAGYPSLSLPTTGMEKWKTNLKNQNMVSQAFCDLYRALGAGYDLLLPLRQHNVTDQQFFPEPLQSQDPLFNGFEPSFWGLENTTPNFPLARYYTEQLNQLIAFTHLSAAEKQEKITQKPRDPFFQAYQEGQQDRQKNAVSWFKGKYGFFQSVDPTKQTVSYSPRTPHE